MADSQAALINKYIEKPMPFINRSITLMAFDTEEINGSRWHSRKTPSGAVLLPAEPDPYDRSRNPSLLSVDEGEVLASDEFYVKRIIDKKIINDKL